MSLSTSTSIRFVISMSICAFLVSGCSGSSDSTPQEQNNVESAEDTNSLDDDMSPQPEDDPAEASPSEQDPGNSEPEDDPAEASPGEQDPGNSEPEDDPVEANPAEQDPDNLNPAVPDPEVQNRTQVDFEIVVPAYQSDALQVRLIWGDTDITASWVGDEFWSATADLPTNTEHTLSVTFYDDNGEIKLASFNTEYKTGVNAAETFQITADQFDSDQWDADEDGASNLDELIAGSDPQVDEESLLPTIDNQQMSLLFIANYFESLLPNERPYMGTEDDTVSDNSGTITTAEIDANGNGSMSIDTLPYIRRNILKGERHVLENAVQWSGSWRFSDDYYLNQTFDSEVSVDGDMRRLVEAGSGSWIGTYSHRWETTVDVTGQLIEGSRFCKVASGTITESYVNNQDTGNAANTSTTMLTITRESVDDYWHVSRAFELDGESSTSEYFARELSMHMIRFGYQRQVSENDYFFCDFGEL